MLRSAGGFTLLELLVTLAVGAVVAGVVSRVMLRQQRFHAGVAAIVERRVQLRHATTIVQAALRDIAPAEGDVVARSDSSLEYLSPLGAGVLCNTLPGLAGLVLAPDSVSAGHTFGFLRAGPRVGDFVFVLSEGPTDAGSDDRWEAHSVAATSWATPACLGSSLTDPVLDAGLSGLVVTFPAGDALGSGVRVGAPVRLARPARLRFYRSAGEWWLGRADRSAGGWASVQPVSGPYRSYAAPGGSSGISLAWFDSTGAPLAPGGANAALARVVITARTRTAAAITIAGIRPGPYDDSLSLGIALRNVP